MPVFSQNLSRAPRRLSVSSRQAAESPIAISPECSGTIYYRAGLALALCRFVPGGAPPIFMCTRRSIKKSSQVKSSLRSTRVTPVLDGRVTETTC